MNVSCYVLTYVVYTCREPSPVLDKGRGTPLLSLPERNSTQSWMALQDGPVKVVQLSSVRFVICMLLYVRHNNMSINIQQDT